MDRLEATFDGGRYIPPVADSSRGQRAEAKSQKKNGELVRVKRLSLFHSRNRVFQLKPHRVCDTHRHTYTVAILVHGQRSMIITSVHRSTNQFLIETPITRIPFSLRELKINIKR